MPSGWYSATLKVLKDAVKSSSGKSFNFMATFVVIEDEIFSEKELEVCFSTGMKNASIMGTLYMMPHTMITHLAAATAGIPVEDVPDELDTDSMKGLKLDIKVEKVIHDGVPLNTISGFLPYGKGKEQAAEQVVF